jgi:peptidoglycan/xylan/chitin deacetylase (PgdA/CDA1 family)
MNTCKIVMYHYVRPIKSSKFPKINGLEKNAFERQINYFLKNYNIINAHDLLDCIYSNNDIKPNSVLLTFDDGFKDHFEYVYPTLKKNEIQGLFFPPVKPISDKIVLDVHKIHFILSLIQNPSEIVKEIFSFIKNNVKEFNLKSASEYYEIYGKANRFDSDEIIFIKRMLQKILPQKLRKKIIDELFIKYVTNNEDLFSSKLYLSIEEIKEMIENNMYIGSHTFSHQWLTSLSEQELKKEISMSLKFLNNFSQKESPIMCYPYGNYNDQIISKLKESGFKAGFTTKVEDARITEYNAFSLSRYDTNDFPQ